MAKSTEGKMAEKIAALFTRRGINTRLLGYFLVEEMTKEELSDVLETFFFIVKAINDSPLPDRLTMDDAKQRMLTDSIVRAMEDSGYYFNN